MNKKYWLIIIILIVLVAGVLYWYLNYQLPKPTSASSVEEATEEITETKEIEGEGIKSIPLEKPPFIK